jgi:hypothetical protein
MNQPIVDPTPLPVSANAGARIIACALTVLKKNPTIALFPAATMIAGFVFFWVFATAFGPALDGSQPWIFQVASFADVHANPDHLFAIASCYLVTMLVATFLNVAFYHEMMEAFAGGRPSVSRGICFAMSRIVPILTWTLFVGSVGLLLRALSERLGWLGKIVVGVTGFAWSVSAVFAIPVLVRDGTMDPVQLLRHSASLVRGTWGELVYGLVRLWLLPTAIMVLFLLTLFLLIPAVTIPAALHSGDTPWWANLGFGVIIAVGALTALVVQMFRDVFHCALYIYATEGVIPAPFSRADLDAAWKIKEP